MFERRKPGPVILKEKAAEAAQQKPLITTKIIMRIDKHLSGPFAGLYMLSTIDREGSEKIVMDANTKRFITVRMHKLLMAVD